MKEHSSTIHLVLRHKWYDLIEKGIKKEEYRLINDYWKNRLGKYSYNYVCFHRGYTTRCLEFEIKNIKRGLGHPEWGAPEFEVYIISLGKLIGFSS